MVRFIVVEKPRGLQAKVIELDVQRMAVVEKKKDCSLESARVLEVPRALLIHLWLASHPAEAACESAIRVITNQSEKVAQLIKRNHRRCFCRAR